jgi:hypothetical protein
MIPERLSERAFLVGSPSPGIGASSEAGDSAGEARHDDPSVHFDDLAGHEAAGEIIQTGCGGRGRVGEAA